MEIKLTKGCICGSLTVDDVEVRDMTQEEKEETLKKIFEELKKEDLGLVRQELVPVFAEDYECDDEPCEQCGDYVETYTWNL